MSIWADKHLIQQWISETCVANNVPDLVPQIKYQFNNRFRSRFGDANLKTMLIRFSAPLWNKATIEQKENSTKHEVSHLITWKLFGNVPAHGEHWKNVMIRAGQSPNRCHNIQLTSKTVNVMCSGCKAVIPMGARRALKMKNGQVYLCKTCGSKVQFL